MQSEVIPANGKLSLSAEVAENSPEYSDENLAGVVPNSFGDLLTATGALNRQTLVFQNTTREIRFVEVNGPKLQKTAYLFKSSSNNSAEVLKDTDSEWQDVEVGTIPERFGTLRGVFGRSRFIQSCVRELRS